MVDIFTNFLSNYPAFTNLILILIIGSVILLMLLKGGFRDIRIIILIICLVFIYLYYWELIPVSIFGVIMLLMLVLIFFLLKSNSFNRKVDL